MKFHILFRHTRAFQKLDCFSERHADQPNVKRVFAVFFLLFAEEAPLLVTSAAIGAITLLDICPN